MKNVPSLLLVNATGQLLQQHAFDHLSDDKLSRMHNCLHSLQNRSNTNNERMNIENELIGLCSEADLYTDTVNPQAMHEWHKIMSFIGLQREPLLLHDEELAG
jgi:hypothetical protein